MVDQRIAVVIESFFNQKGFSQSLSTLKAFESHIQSTNKAMAELSRYNIVLDKFGNFRDAKSNGLMGPTFEKQIVNTNKRMNKFNSNWDATYNSIMKSGNMLSKPQNNMFSSIDSFSKKALKNLKAARANFSMEFLGVMFFGMMIQKAFQSLATSTVSSFMKITEGTTASGQAVNALMISWELLKFSIGSAIASVLESLLPIIFPIIMAISDWVQQHEKLVGWLVIGGIILGSVLFLFGQFYLGIQAIGNAIVSLGAQITSFTEGLALMNVGWAGIISWIVIAIAIAAILYAAWITNFGGIQEFVGGTLGIIWELFKTVFGGLWDLIKTFFQWVVAIFKGDWAEVWNLTKKFGAQLFALLLKIVAGLGMILYNAMAFIYNIVKDALKIIIKLFLFFAEKTSGIFIDLGIAVVKALLTPLQSVINMINRVISSIASIDGFGWVNRFKLADVNVDAITRANDKLKQTQASMFQNMSGGVDSFFDKIDAGYFNADNFKAMSDFVDDNNQYIKNLEEVPNTVAVAVTASATITEANMQETESWNLKTEAVDKYLKTLEDYQKNANKSNIYGISDMSLDSPNFVFKR